MIVSRRKILENAGYSLIEVLVGIMILSIAIGSAFSLSFSVNRTMIRNQRVTAAANLAEYKLEELRNMPYAGIIDGSDASAIDAFGNTPGEFTRSWTVSSDTPEAGLKTVTVSITWSILGDPSNYTMAGVIGS